MGNYLGPLFALLEKEDLQKLLKIIQLANSGVEKAISSLPKEVQKLIVSTKIEEDLRDEPPDFIAITITFSICFGTNETKTVIPLERIFYIECLSENIDEITKKKFEENVYDVILHFCKFLYDAADRLHNILHS